MDDLTPEDLATLPLTAEECDALAVAIGKVTAVRYGAKVELRMRGDDGSGALALVLALPRLCATVRKLGAMVELAGPMLSDCLAAVSASEDALKAERMMMDSHLAAALDAAQPAAAGGKD